MSDFLATAEELAGAALERLGKPDVGQYASVVLARHIHEILALFRDEVQSSAITTELLHEANDREMDE